MIKDKLYTANKWNQPAFMPKDSSISTFGLASPIKPSGGIGSLSEASPTKFFGLENTSGSTTGGGGISGFLGGIGDKLGDVMGGGKLAGSPIGGLVGGIGSAVGGIAGSAIADGFENGAGTAIGNIGSTVGSAISNVNPILGGIVSAGSGIVGGLVNRAFGTKVDQAKLNAVNEGISRNNNFVSNAGSFDEIKGPEASFTNTNVYSDGWFTSSAGDKNEELARKLADSRHWAFRSVDNNISNLQNDQLNTALANYSAFGGPIETGDMGAIDYDFMTDYLTQKKRENDMKSKMGGIVPMPAFMPNSFAIGGDLQTNGADWSDGLVTIGAGGSHEENKYEGVQVGVDNEGTPNLVEEGETIWNDYVFSARIPIDQTTKEMFHIGKKREMTYADLSKKLEKEIAERVNDPISKAGFEKQMQMLEEQQERQKQEMEAERAKAAFEALSPEEQTALMQQRAEQEAMAQQAAMQEAAAQQQPTPEELAIAQQQQQMADGSEAVLGQESQIAANGGKLYKDGGNTKKNAGTWKKGTSKENWDKYSRNGLRDFLMKVNDDLVNADTEEEKNKIRENAIKTVRGIQQAYSEAYQNNLTPSEVSEKVTALQKAFQKAGGNAYFGDIADNINLPKGHNTADTEEKGWVDGLWGPRTSIRNWGSTEYGDDYDDIRELAASAGLTYAPGQYKYGDNTLYELGMAQPDVAATPDAEDPYSEGWEERGGVSTTPVTATTPETLEETDGKDIKPKHKAGWLRYAGLFGPAVGLSMQALGIGRPDTAQLDAAIQGAGDVSTAKWNPLGNYLTYRPLDVWYQQNALNAQSRATDRALLNSSSPSRMAGLLANGYNSQIASGNLFRQAQEYNDALREKVESFNRGTNQFNSEQYGITSRFNADARNRARQANAQLRLHAAAQKADMDAGWNQGIYGNLTGLFKGIGDIGRENEQFNWLSDLAADGAFGNLGTSNTSRRWTKDKKAKGGKMKKKGLTI